MKRRDFFKIAGISGATAAFAGATTLLGCSSDAGTTDSSNASKGETYRLLDAEGDIKFSLTCDVLIVGSGIAGLSAALPLAQAGKSVVIAEKLDLLGGAAVNSTGLIYVAGTEIQKDAGITRTVDEAWETRLKALQALNIPHPERAKTLFFGATEWVNILAQECGSEFQNPADYFVLQNGESQPQEDTNNEDAKGESAGQGETDTSENTADSAATPDTSDKSTEQDTSANESTPNQENVSTNGTSSETLAEASQPGFLLPRNGIGDMVSVMAPLRDTLSTLGVTFLAGHRAQSFIANDRNDLCGIRFRVEKSNTSVDIKAQSIVIATGGFASSPYYVHKYASNWDQAGSYSFSETGDGLRLCSNADIALTGMDQHVYLIGDIPWTEAWNNFAPTLVVDPAGARFANEDSQITVAETCFKDAHGYWWTIFDNHLVKSSQGRSVAELVNKNTLRVIGPVDTKEDLAKAMGLSETALDQVFSDYAASVEAGSDSFFGRTKQLIALEPPYYAIKQRPVRFATVGGVNTDDAGHVLSGMSVASKNVYACGAVADGGGEGIASCGTCGLLVGRSVLADLESAEQSD